MPVFAITWYEVLDRNGAMILRNTRPPVDLSNAGAPAREAMRGRGELLVIFDTENCVLVGRPTADGGKTLTADEIVAGWKPMLSEKKSAWGTYSSRYGGLLPQEGAPPATPTP
jgi:hypothetical protein